jgi:hypothetical protein
VVEHVAEPADQSGTLRQGEVDGGLERPLEVPFALVDTAIGGEGVVGAAEMSVTEGCHEHASRQPESCDEYQ